MKNTFRWKMIRKHSRALLEGHLFLLLDGWFHQHLQSCFSTHSTCFSKKLLSNTNSKHRNEVTRIVISPNTPLNCLCQKTLECNNIIMVNDYHQRSTNCLRSPDKKPSHLVLAIHILSNIRKISILHLSILFVG